MSGNKIRRSLTAGALPLALFLCGAIAWAHHAIAGKFDVKQTRELSGIVTNVDWRNPHVHVFMNVTGGGATLNWAVELESPSLLEMDGWKRETLRPGDAIIVRGNPALD